jgi:hypothetical protein
MADYGQNKHVVDYCVLDFMDLYSMMVHCRCRALFLNIWSPFKLLFPTKGAADWFSNVFLTCTRLVIFGENF